MTDITLQPYYAFCLLSPRKQQSELVTEPDWVFPVKTSDNYFSTLNTVRGIRATDLAVGARFKNETVNGTLTPLCINDRFDLLHCKNVTDDDAGTVSVEQHEEGAARNRILQSRAQSRLANFDGADQEAEHKERLRVSSG